MTEWIWIFLVFWVFITVFGWVKKDDIIRAIAGLLGVMFGILYLSTHFLTGLGMILLNFYLVFDAID